MTLTPERSDEISEPLSNQVRGFVTSRIERLYRNKDRGPTKATLAHLRAAVATPPGADPRVSPITMEGAPGQGHTDAPSPSENAIHHALTLYARHQQSRPENMHRSQRGFGTAIRILHQRSAVGRGEEGNGLSPVRRRFDALVAATTYEALIYHLRNIISQLRSENISFDYGALAVDLLQWQNEKYRDSVKLRWARGFHRVPADDPGTQPSNIPTTSPDSKEQS